MADSSKQEMKNEEEVVEVIPLLADRASTSNTTPNEEERTSAGEGAIPRVSEALPVLTAASMPDSTSTDRDRNITSPSVPSASAQVAFRNERRSFLLSQDLSSVFSRNPRRFGELESSPSVSDENMNTYSPLRVLALNLPSTSSSTYDLAADAYALSRTIRTMEAASAERHFYFNHINTFVAPSQREHQEPDVESAERHNTNLENETFPEDNLSIQSSVAPTPRYVNMQTPVSVPRPILGRWSPNGTPMRPPRPILGRRLIFSPALSRRNSNESIDSIDVVANLFEDSDNASEEEEMGITRSSIVQNPSAGDGDNVSEEEEEEMGITRSSIVQNPSAWDGDNVSEEEGGERGFSSPVPEENPSGEDGDKASKKEGDEKDMEKNTPNRFATRGKDPKP